MNLVRLQPKGGGSDIQPYIVIFNCDSVFDNQELVMHYEGTPHAGETVEDVSGIIVNGTHTLYPLHDGVWSILVTSGGGNTFSGTITLEKWGTYNVSVSDMGYGDWLKAADIADTFSSLENVLADEKTVRELMTKHASADYLYNWYVANNTIFDTLLASRFVCKWIGLRDYICDKFFENDNAKDALINNDNHWTVDGAENYGWEYILKDKVPVMTSDSAPYGTAFNDGGASNSYKSFAGNNTKYCAISSPSGKGIGYEFVNPSQIEKAKFWGSHNSFDGILQATNDTTWIDLSERIKFDGENNTQEIIVSKNKGYYKKYRIKCVSLNEGEVLALSNIQFYGRQLSVSVPVMTSDTEPWGEVFANDSLVSENYDFKPFHAFNRNYADYNRNAGWLPATNEVGVSCIGYDFKKDVKVKTVMIYKSDTNNRNIRGSLDFQYWNSKSNSFESTGDVVKTGAINTWNCNDITSEQSSNKFRLLYKDNEGSSSDLNLLKNGSGIWLQVYGLDYSEREFGDDDIEMLYEHGLKLDGGNFIEGYYNGLANHKTVDFEFKEDYILASPRSAQDGEMAFGIVKTLGNYDYLIAENDGVYLKSTSVAVWSGTVDKGNRGTEVACSNTDLYTGKTYGTVQLTKVSSFSGEYLVGWNLNGYSSSLSEKLTKLYLIKKGA